MKNSIIIIIWGIIISYNSIIAQPNYPPPSGVWCSCPPTTGLGSASVMPAVALKSYVKGILVRVVWKDIETADNVYNWSLIDEQITAAQSFGKKISIAVGTGPNSPDWLYAMGIPTLSYSLPFSGIIPVPWDSTFLNKWTDFISILGSKYANDTIIQLVYITNSSANGFEMQLPFNPVPDYNSSGYSVQSMFYSWKIVIDAFNNAFPNHYLTNDFHPVNSSNAIADSVYDYAKNQIGSRYGASAWWWTQKNTTVYASQYSIMQNSASTNLFTGIQMAHSGVNSSGSFGPGGMPAALDLAISNHICYWEIWNSDITDGSFESLLFNAVCSPLLETADINNTEDNLTVFPNPSNKIFTISLKNNYIRHIEVINELGVKVFEKDNIWNSQFLLDISDKIDGICFLKVTDDKKTILFRKLILIPN